MVRTLAPAVAVLLAACSNSPSRTEPKMVTISIGADALSAALALGGKDAHVIDRGTDFDVVQLPEDDLEQLAEIMHGDFHRCGGFMVHDSIAAAEAPLAPRPADFDYTLDRGPLVAATLPTIEAANIHRTIAELSAMKNRYYEAPTGVAASEWLRDRWRALAADAHRSDVTVQLFGDKAQKSVILTIPGSDPALAKDIVVVGGHLDSITWPKRGDTRAPGADDDASGIATETEVLRALLAKDYRPARTVQFMGYAAEEVGLRGSQAIVADYVKRKVPVVGALQLDMTNYQGSDKDIWLMKDFADAKQNDFIVKLIQTYTPAATVGFDACGYACSDHASWMRGGYRASMPFEARSREYNKNIHTADDTLEQSGNNANHAVKFARVAAAYVIELAKGTL